MGDVIIECNDVMKIYESATNVKIPALRGIDLNINDSDIISLIGPSGAGKTTLIKVIGMIEELSSGEITYNGPLGHLKFSEASSSDKLKFRRELFGYLFQLPEMNVLFHLTALQNITYPMKIVGKLTREEQRKRALNLLEILNIDKPHHNKHPNKLSGGELQRLSISVALANDPPIILADEPTGELDRSNKNILMHNFKTLNQELGKTFVIVTHDQRFSTIADYRYKLLDGKIVSVISTKKQVPKNSQEIQYVSDIGEVVIPQHILLRYNFEKTARLRVIENTILVSPAEVQVDDSTSELDEYSYISDTGKLIIPKNLRKKCKIIRKVKLKTLDDYIKIKPENKEE